MYYISMLLLFILGIQFPRNQPVPPERIRNSTSTLHFSPQFKTYSFQSNDICAEFPVFRENCEQSTNITNTFRLLVGNDGMFSGIKADVS